MIIAICPEKKKENIKEWKYSEKSDDAVSMIEG